MKLHVYFRSCEGVDAFTGPRRMVGPKRDVILTSLNSLARSIHQATKECGEIKLTIIDDHSSDKLLLDMARIVDSHKIWYTTIQMQKTGNGASLLANFEDAQASMDDLLLFTEDDYLYTSDAIEEMLIAYHNFTFLLNKKVILHPSDYPDRYLECEPSYIFLAGKHHWRNITKTTCTFMIHRELMEQNWQLFTALGGYGEDPTISEESTINKLLTGTFRGFSPIPTLAVHLQYESTIPPFTLWDSWWKSEKSDLDRILR